MKTYIIWNLKEEAFLVVDPDGYEKVSWTRNIKSATEFTQDSATSLSMHDKNDLPIPSPYCYEFL